MSGQPGYAFAVSMAVAATMVAGFALATLVTVSGVLADRNAQQPDASRVCPGWWFGHSAKEILATRKRMCGK